MTVAGPCGVSTSMVGAPPRSPNSDPELPPAGWPPGLVRVVRFAPVPLLRHQRNDLQATFLGRTDPVHLGTPGDQHRPPLPGRRGPPHPVAVASLQRPGQTRALNVAAATQRNRTVGRFARSRKKGFWIDRLTCTTSSPRRIELPFTNSAKQSRIASSCGDLVRAWHPRPGHAPTSPVGQPARLVGCKQQTTLPTGRLFYRTTRGDNKGLTLHRRILPVIRPKVPLKIG